MHFADHLRTKKIYGTMYIFGKSLVRDFDALSSPPSPLSGPRPEQQASRGAARDGADRHRALGAAAGAVSGEEREIRGRFFSPA